MLVSVLLVASSPALDWLGLACALSVVGVAGMLSVPTRRKHVVVGLVVAGSLALAGTAMAFPYNCLPSMKWLGLC